MKHALHLTLLVPMLLLASACDHKIELTGPVTLKTDSQPASTARRVKEICIGSVIGASQTNFDRVATEEIPEIGRNHELIYSVQDCLDRGFQPVGDWVVIPGGASPFSNKTFRPAAFKEFVKYEDEP